MTPASVQAEGRSPAPTPGSALLASRLERAPSPDFLIGVAAGSASRQSSLHRARMKGMTPYDADLLCEALRWVSDEPHPGLVEVAFTDVEGRRHTFIDKPPVFSTESSVASSAFPAKAAIRVRVVEDGEPLVVSTDVDGVESIDGQTEFRVGSHQLRRSR